MAKNGKRPFVEVTTPDRWGTEVQRNIKGFADQVEEIRRGLLAFAAVIKAGDYTIGEETFIVYTGPGGHTFTVPKSTALGGKARVFYVLNLGSGANGDLAIAASGSDTIDDTSRIALGAGLGVTLVNDGESQTVSQAGGFGSGAASWSGCRYFFIDYDAGDDHHVGYIDGAPGATFTAAAASAVALKTVERLYEIVPQLGNGRAIVILQKPRAAFANYLDRDGVTESSLDTSRYSGYRTFIWRGSTDLTNTAADKATCGFGIALTGPNADSSYTVAAGATSTVVPIAAGAIGAEAATQFRIRFLATTATATLRNVCRVITSCVLNTSVTCGNALPAVPGATDQFVIERPGVRMKELNFDCRDFGDLTVGGPLGAHVIGMAFTGSAINSVLVLGHRAFMCGIEAVTVTTNTVFQCDLSQQLAIDVAWFDETQATVNVGMGYRTQSGSNVKTTAFMNVIAFGAMNLSATTGLQIPGTGSNVGSRSYFGGNTQVQGVGGYGCRESGGSCKFGDPTTSNAQPRLVSGGSITPLQIFNGPVSCWRLKFENFGAATHGCIYYKNIVGGSANIDGCTSDGAGPYGVDISGCFGVTFQFGNTIANTITGTLGDIRTAPFNGPVVIAHADLTKVGFTDPNGNVLKGTADITAGPTVAVTNAAGAALSPGHTVYLSAASSVAKSNAAAAPTAIIDGIMVSSTPIGNVGLMVAPEGLPYVLCEAAPAANAKMYLSAVTPGTIVGAAPGIPIIVGRNIDGNGVKTAVRVSMNPR